MKKFRNSENGFTLIELMIGVVIVGILAALAAPNFQAAYTKHSFQSGNKKIVSTLKQARSFAIADKEPYGVHFNVDAMTITLFRDKTNLGGYTFDSGDSTLRIDTLPPQFTWMNPEFDNNVITFRPNGSAGFAGTGSIHTAAQTEGMLGSFSTDILASTGRISSSSHFYTF